MSKRRCGGGCLGKEEWRWVSREGGAEMGSREGAVEMGVRPKLQVSVSSPQGPKAQ